LSTNIRLSGELLTVTSTLTLYNTIVIAAVKSLIVQVPVFVQRLAVARKGRFH
jgi:hypothetical protein